MSRRFFGRERETERLLRLARPRPDDELVERLAARADSPVGRRVRPSGRLVVAGAVTALMVAALASVGGIGYAASTVAHVVSQATSKATYMGHRMVLLPQNDQTAAGSQYLGTTTPTVTTTTTTTTTSSGSGGGTTTTTVPAVTTTASGGSATVTAQAGQQTLHLSVPTGSTVSSSVTVTVSFSQTPTSLAIQVFDPTTPVGASTSLTAVIDAIAALQTTMQHAAAGTGIVTGTSFVSVGAAGSEPGTVVQFAAPLEVVLSGVNGLFTPKAFRASSIATPVQADPRVLVPLTTQDGVTIRLLKRLSGPNGDLGATGDGYYLDSAGDVHILTLHSGIFGLGSRFAANVSESGRAFQKLGSGKFGDPALTTPGPPVLKQVGRKVSVRRPKSGGAVVPAAFYVDEQASIHLSIFRGSRKIAIVRTGSSIRGSVLRGGAVKNLHVVVLRPGTVKLRLRVPRDRLVPGRRYRLRVWARDYDGNKTVAYIPFTG